MTPTLPSVSASIWRKTPGKKKKLLKSTREHLKDPKGSSPYLLRILSKFNPLQPSVAFLYPLKTSGNLKVF